MRIVEIREKTFAISRYPDPGIPSGGLTTSAVALRTDVIRDGKPVVGFGFASFGRFAQGGLIRERFAPRLLQAGDEELLAESGKNFDPFRAWACMMKNEKPGGHGERCVAVGALDMALWDAAAKIAELPLYRYLARALGLQENSGPVPVYAGGGYPYPADDLRRLADEVRGYLDQGFTRVKIKIGSQPLEQDLKRIETALKLLPGGDCLAVDAMNRFSLEEAVKTARALTPYHLAWFEDPCDPLDFKAHRQLSKAYALPVATGEALFSFADARNLLRYAGLRPEQDLLVFDPAHCYGIPEYLKIISLFEGSGWPRSAFLPHGGHLFSLHVASALGLGGCEANPANFQPFGGFSDGAEIASGTARPPEAPGIGFETRGELRKLFGSILAD